MNSIDLPTPHTQSNWAVHGDLKKKATSAKVSDALKATRCYRQKVSPFFFARYSESFFAESAPSCHGQEGIDLGRRVDNDRARLAVAATMSDWIWLAEKRKSSSGATCPADYRKHSTELGLLCWIGNGQKSSLPIPFVVIGPNAGGKRPRCLDVLTRRRFPFSRPFVQL